MGNAWVIPLKDKNCITITNAFQKILDESNHKPNKIRVDKGRTSYHRSMEAWLEKNDIEMYSTNNEGNSVVAEMFIRTLNTKIYKYMTSTSKDVYIDKLDEIVNNHNNTYHGTIKINPVDLNPSMYIDFNKENNKEGRTLIVGDSVSISKYKNIFAKGYVPNWSEEVFVIKKVKNTAPWIYVISDLNGEELPNRFTKKNCKKTNKKEFRVEKVIKRKGDKLYVKWKG